MKSPHVAFWWSFLLPGAGLVYLGKWKLGLVNLAVALAIGVLSAAITSPELLHKHMHYVAMGLSAGSGSLAFSLAKQMSKSPE